jgi:hypothetical protein
MKSSKPGSDTFYDHVDYYDSRNMFNNLDEEVRPENRLYTNLNIKRNYIWDNKKEDNEEEINRNIILDNIKHFKNENNKSLACKLCGFTGHLAYQCRNNVNLKQNNISNENNEKYKNFLENFIKLRKEEKKLEKDNLFQKIYKNKLNSNEDKSKNNKKHKKNYHHNHEHHHHHHSHNKKQERSRSKSK